MRIITKDRKVDIPYDHSVLCIEKIYPMHEKYCLIAETNGKRFALNTYDTEEQAKEELSEIHKYYYNGLHIYQIKRKERS